MPVQHVNGICYLCRKLLDLNYNIMRRFLFLTAACIMIAACNNKSTQTSQICVHTLPVAVAPDATNGDEYLYTVTYSELDYFAAGEYIKELYGVLDMDPGACTSVRNGRYYGRNLDYYVNECPDLVITTLAGKDRFASIGTSADFPLCTKKAIDEGTLSELNYAAAAYYMNDGINENGVAINSNVVPAGECDHTTGTNPGAPTIVTNGVVRYVLDHAKSVDHAIELLREVNIVAPSADKFHFESHWMISDPSKTVILEIWNNELVVVDDCVMTNFYVSHPDTPMGIGHERYEVMKTHYDEGSSQEGMRSLMKRAWYSNAYSSKTDPLWYTEDLEQGCGYTWNDIKAGNVEKAYQDILDGEAAYISVDYQKSKRDGTEWYTTHSIVYDLEERTMSLVCQENDTVWNFKL